MSNHSPPITPPPPYHRRIIAVSYSSMLKLSVVPVVGVVRCFCLVPCLSIICRLPSAFPVVHVQARRSFRSKETCRGVILVSLPIASFSDRYLRRTSLRLGARIGLVRLMSFRRSRIELPPPSACSSRVSCFLTRRENRQTDRVRIAKICPSLSAMPPPPRLRLGSTSFVATYTVKPAWQGSSSQPPSHRRVRPSNMVMLLVETPPPPSQVPAALSTSQIELPPPSTCSSGVSCFLTRRENRQTSRVRIAKICPSLSALPPPTCLRLVSTSFVATYTVKPAWQGSSSQPPSHRRVRPSNAVMLLVETPPPPSQVFCHTFGPLLTGYSPRNS
ncbi:unnamed protein product [Acanthosepion pharaonis]|uniref:Uncharacterized protein n=1 Tax=Acanthosepion pharaonis TaxID=158019 RepID=A0A812DSE5_ACAPH|nr:unnamed protein product [Sepia pharaonis]